MIKLYDILKAEKTGLSDSLFTALLAKKLSGSPAATVKTLEGVPPLTFSAIGEPLIEWSIDGNMVQDGIPTSSSPIFPSETGELVESGAHVGEYAIPVVCGGSTNNIYLSEPIRKISTYADTAASTGVATRKIKKLVLTGEETWYSSSTWKGDNTSVYYFSQSGAISSVGTEDVQYMYSDRFKGVSRNELRNGDTEMIAITGVGAITLRVSDTFALQPQDFKQWLADQYSNGSPVCVWYVLATPTTESFTAPTIPTVNGSNTFNVNATLAPSNVYIKYKG